METFQNTYSNNKNSLQTNCNTYFLFSNSLYKRIIISNLVNFNKIFKNMKFLYF